MPKFRIICSTSKNYCLTVEAPDIVAVRAWYEGSDGEEFEEGEEGCWHVVDMYKLPSSDVMTPKIKINEEGDGEPVNEELVEDSVIE